MIAVSVPISLHLHASSVSILNEINFSDWKEQVQFHLGVLDLYIALESEKPTAISNDSSAEEKSIFKAWEISNRLSLKFMRITVANNIKSTLPVTDNVKEFLKSVGEHF